MDEKLLAIPYGFRFSRTITKDLENKLVKREIKYRVNGFSRGFERTMVSLVLMNKNQEKEKIISVLNEYLIIIKIRNLCDIEPVEYEHKGLLSKLLQKNPIFNLVGFIFKFFKD